MLAVWLPLNENFKNQGLGECSTITMSSSSWHESIIGKGLYNNKQMSNIITVNELVGATEFSISVWWKLNEEDMETSTNYSQFLSVYADVDDIKNQRIRIEHCDNSTQGGHVQSLFPRSSTNFSTAYIGWKAHSGNKYAWNHEVITCDGTFAKCYLNGNLLFNISCSDIFVNNMSLNGKFSLGGYGCKTCLNDFRIYSHCISAKEVKHLSQCLLLHYPMNQIANPAWEDLDSWFDGVEYDTSGYCNNGLISSTPPTLIYGSPRYNGCYEFNGTNNYIACGRSAMVKDELTVNIWAYMESWSSYNSRLASCTEFGGWAFEPNGEYIQFVIGIGTVSNSYIYARSKNALSSLTSGWHMFTGVYDGYTGKIYIDGILMGSSATLSVKTPIFYNTTNGIFIGAESGTNQIAPVGGYFDGKLSDFRIYSTVLSTSDIESLYKTSASITNTGTLLLSGEVCALLDKEFKNGSSAFTQSNNNNVLISKNGNVNCKSVLEGADICSFGKSGEFQVGEIIEM